MSRQKFWPKGLQNQYKGKHWNYLLNDPVRSKVFALPSLSGPAGNTFFQSGIQRQAGHPNSWQKKKYLEYC